MDVVVAHPLCCYQVVPPEVILWYSTWVWNHRKYRKVSTSHGTSKYLVWRRIRGRDDTLDNEIAYVWIILYKCMTSKYSNCKTTKYCPSGTYPSFFRPRSKSEIVRDNSKQQTKGTRKWPWKALATQKQHDRVNEKVLWHRNKTSKMERRDRILRK